MSLIWTNHALKRANERRIDQEKIKQTVYSPDKIIEKGKNAAELSKNFGEQIYFAIIKNEDGNRVVLSCWVFPPNPGTSDFKRRERTAEMRKASMLKKFWLTILNQLDL